MTPFWDPSFTPPCGQLGDPFLYAHNEPGPNYGLCTQKKVPGPAFFPVSCWPCPGQVGYAWERRHFW